MIVFAEIASFTNHAGATETALGVSGGVAVILACAGRLPTEVDIGDNRLKFSEDDAVGLADSVANVLDPLAIAPAAAATDIALDSAVNPAQQQLMQIVSQRLGEHAVFHAAALTAIQTVGSFHRADVSVQPHPDGSWDAVVSGSGRSVWVEVTLSLEVAGARRIAAMTRELPAESSVLVVAATVDAVAEAELGKSNEAIAIVEWRGDSTTLRTLLGQLLRPPE